MVKNIISELKLNIDKDAEYIDTSLINVYLAELDNAVGISLYDLVAGLKDDSEFITEVNKGTVYIEYLKHKDDIKDDIINLDKVCGHIKCIEIDVNEEKGSRITVKGLVTPTGMFGHILEDRLNKRVSLNFKPRVHDGKLITFSLIDW